MKKNISNFLVLALLSILFCQCKQSRQITIKADAQQNLRTLEVDEKRNAEIAQKNKQAWEEATKVRDSITDSTFLKTKQPMSDDAIAPYDYQTGLVGDRPYNQIIYVKALERAKKRLAFDGKQVVLNVKSGAEINISEDLYKYICDLFNGWNTWLKSGKYKIVKTEEGYYEIMPIPKDKRK